MNGKKRDFSKQWKKFFWIAGLFVALVFLLYFRFILSRQPVETTQKPFPVKAIPVVTEEVKLYDTVVGKVEGEQSVRVFAGASGFVVEVAKSRGDKVAKGQVIVALEDSSRLYELREAEGLFSSARTDFDEAERKYRQYQRLFDKGVVSKDDFESARSVYLKSSSQLEAFEASYKKANWYYNRLKVRSPINGTVVEIFPDTGQEVMAGETVAKVAGDKTSTVVAGVDSSIAKRAEVGRKVLVEYKTADGKRSVQGTVKGVSTETDEGSTTYSVEAGIDDEAFRRELWSGEFVNLKIESGMLSGIVRVPITAFLYDGRKPFVFIVSDGKSQRVDLSRNIVWLDSETAAVAGSDFPEGSWIITEGNSRLYEGQTVMILKER